MFRMQDDLQDANGWATNEAMVARAAGSRCRHDEMKSRASGDRCAGMVGVASEAAIRYMRAKWLLKTWSCQACAPVAISMTQQPNDLSAIMTTDDDIQRAELIE